MTVSDFILLVLTESQMDKVLTIIDGAFHAVKEGIQAVWIALAPFGIGWLTWRQYKINQEREKNAKITHAKIEENTEITVAAKESIDNMAKLRGMVTNSVKPSEGKMVEFALELPGYAYEKFNLAEGAPVLWKSEKCEKGRMCRFAVAGESRMGFHAHDVTEILKVITGVLEIGTNEGTFHIGPGQEFTSPIDQVHSVGFCGFGEVEAHWPEQETNELNIRIYT